MMKMTRLTAVLALFSTGALVLGQWSIPDTPQAQPDYYDELRSLPDSANGGGTTAATQAATVDDGLRGSASGSGSGGSTRSNLITFSVPSSCDPSSATQEGCDADSVAGGVDTYQVCELTTLLPYTYTASIDQTEAPRARVHEDSAAVLAAIYLFNNAGSSAELGQALDSIVTPPFGDGLVTSASGRVSESLQNCAVRFTTSFVNTFSSPIKSTSTLTEIFQSPHTPQQPQPCAVIGPYSSMVTSPTAILSSVKNTLHVSYAASSTDFDNKEQYPKFARLCSNNIADARAILSYLHDSVGVSHLGMIFVTDSFGSSMAKSIQDSASEYNITVDPVSISFDSYTPGRRGEIVNAVRHLKNTEYRYFLGVMMDVHYEAVMKEAHAQGIVGTHEDGGQYAWLLSGVDVEMMRTMVGQYEKDTILAAASQGVGILRLSGPRGSEAQEPTTTNYQSFQNVYKQAIEDPEFLNYVISKQPNEFYGTDGQDPEFQAEPTEWGHFLFDTVLGVGLAACNASVANDSPPDGEQLYDTFTKVEYGGASGLVRLDAGTGTRRADSVTYELMNIKSPHSATTRRALEQSADLTITASSVFQSTDETPEGGTWTVVDAFVYADGTTETPSALPPPNDNPNYIGNASRIAGLILAALVVALAVVFTGWTVYKRTQHIVMASQPAFLVMLCFGCVVMASAIVPLSLEETVASQEGLDIACMAFPWLYVMGFTLMFSALFAKTWQLYKVYRDPDLDCITVTWRHLLYSFVFFFLVNGALLLTWTFQAPLKWERIYKPSKDQFDRPIESYGTCTVIGDKASAALAFVVVTLAFNLSALLFANVRAYQARSIKTEYRESHYIAITMASILQAWCLGIPIMIVVFETPQAKFWVETGIIFVTSTATLLLMFVPKLIAHRNELIKEAAERRRQAHRSRERRSQEAFDTDMDSSVPANSKSSIVLRTSETAQAVDVEAPAKTEEKESGASGASDTPNGGIKVVNNPGVEGQTTDELKAKLAAAQQKNSMLQEENSRIERELKDLKTNTSSQ